MQETKISRRREKEKKCKGGSVPGEAGDGGWLTGLRWRGSWMAVPGGVAAVSNSDEQFFFLPSPSVFFRSQWLSILDLVLFFWFRFPSSRFVSVLLSLFGSLSLSPYLLGSLGSSFCSVFSSYL